MHSGIRIRPYEIASAIGAGGMGEVFRARDTRLNRDVAVKLLPKDFVMDADRLAGSPNVREVRIRGTIAAVELDVPGGYLAPIGRQLRRHCLDRGVLLRPLGNVLYAMPPACLDDAECTLVAKTMGALVRGL